MEEKKTIFDYLTQILVIFGFSMLVLNIFCLAFGDSAKEISAMFKLGSDGVPLEVAAQFLVISVLITGARMLFFTDSVIKRMSLPARTAGMLITVIIIIAVFISVFRWFPVAMWQPWAMFLVCFGLSFLGSYLVMRVKEKTENQRLEEALRRLKEREPS